MNISVKKWLSALLIIASIVLVIWIAFSNSELENAWAALSHLDPLWMAGILGCWFIYMGFEAIGTWIYLRSERFSISFGRSVISTLVGFYYSNITPSAAGGQPMQVNSLRRAGIPVGYGTMAATIRLISNQFMISVISLVLWRMNREFVSAQLGDSVWLARIGWVINFMVVPLVLMAAFQRNLIQKLAIWLIHFGKKIHIVRNEEPAVASVTNVLDTYHVALKELISKPSRIIVQLFCSSCSALGLMGSIYFVYHAFGFSGTPWYHLLTISFLLYVSACYTPLPGASGAQEGGFLLYYKGLIPDDRIGLALLVWRFFTYYLFILVGLVNVILDRFLKKHEVKGGRDDG